MKTFFCRHSSKLDIDNITFQNLWTDDYIAIHYPHQKDGALNKTDNSSLNAIDYAAAAKGAMNNLNKLSKEGGYVFASYEHRDEYKIGIIEPNTKIQLIEGNWGKKNTLYGRKAILKGLKFKSVKILNPLDAISLTSGQPRQGTLCHWQKIGKRVENNYNDVRGKKSLDDLTPDLQEVFCSEFMRMGLDKKLPKLEFLLTPIGRTLKDVDIIGLTKEKMKVLVQVTYSYEPKTKINQLRKYENENCLLVMFCKTKKSRNVNGVQIYSIDDAFNTFKKTDKGKEWIISVN